MVELIATDYWLYDGIKAPPWNVRAVRVKEGVKVIKERAFLNCAHLLLIEIANTVERIGYSAFFGCSALLSARFPASLKEINIGAFNQCTSLMFVEFVPNSSVIIRQHAFAFCTSLTTIMHFEKPT